MRSDEFPKFSLEGSMLRIILSPDQGCPNSRMKTVYRRRETPAFLLTAALASGAAIGIK
jgi:hypothetical protein